MVIFGIRPWRGIFTLQARETAQHCQAGSRLWHVSAVPLNPTVVVGIDKIDISQPTQAFYALVVRGDCSLPLTRSCQSCAFFDDVLFFPP